MIDFREYIKPGIGGRFRLLDSPAAIPGHCVVCRSSKSDDRLYLDFGFDIDWYGVVYFCTHCLEESMGYMGWINPEKYEELFNKLQVMELEVNNIKEENARLRIALDSLDFIGSRRIDDVQSPDLYDEIELPKSPEGTIRKESDNNGSPKQINEQRSDDILSNEQINKSGTSINLE